MKRVTKKNEAVESLVEEFTKCRIGGGPPRDMKFTSKMNTNKAAQSPTTMSVVKTAFDKPKHHGTNWRSQFTSTDWLLFMSDYSEDTWGSYMYRTWNRPGMTHSKRVWMDWSAQFSPKDWARYECQKWGGVDDLGDDAATPGQTWDSDTPTGFAEVEDANQSFFVDLFEEKPTEVEDVDVQSETEDSEVGSYYKPAEIEDDVTTETESEDMLVEEFESQTTEAKTVKTFTKTRVWRKSRF